jgi:hypothetical protein
VHFFVGFFGNIFMMLSLGFSSIWASSPHPRRILAASSSDPASGASITLGHPKPQPHF